MHKFRVSLTAALLGSVFSPVLAQAQEASPVENDVVMMRRILPITKVKSPVPSPVPTPTPTPPATQTYRKVATVAVPMSLTFPLSGGEFVFSTALSGVECRDAKDAVVSPSKCANIPNPADVGLIGVPASGHALLRRISFDPQDLQARVPTLKNVTDLCSSQVHINGQVWALNCRTGEAQADPIFVKVPTAVVAPPQDGLGDGTITLTTPPAGVKCYAVGSGQEVASSSCNSTVPGEVYTPPNIGSISVPMKHEPAVRTIVVDPGTIGKTFPDITDESLVKLCSSVVMVDGVPWKLSCNADDLRVHYARMATTAIAQNLSGNTPTAGKANYQAPMLFSSSATGIVCIDTDNGNPVAGSHCDYLPVTPDMGTISVPATYSPSYRTVVFDQSALAQRMPKITNMAALCSSSVNMDGAQGAPQEMWHVRCDPSAIADRYVKVATVAVPASSPMAQGALPTPGKANFTGQALVNTAASGVRCRDTQTGQYVSDETRCDFVLNPPGVGTIPVPATFASWNRRALINFDDILRVSPSVANRNEFCSSILTTTGLTAEGEQTSEGWFVTCDAASIRNHYQKVATNVVPATSPVSVIFPTEGKANFDGEIVVSAGAGGVVCRDTDDGRIVEEKICQYMPFSGASVAAVPAKFSPVYGKVFVNFDAVQAIFPDATNESSFCAANVTISGRSADGRSASESWRITCDEGDLRMHHMKVPTTPAPTQTTVSLTGPTNASMPNFDGQLNFSGLAGSVLCRDTDSSAFVNASFCANLTVPPEQSSFKVPAKFSPTLRTVLINFDDVLAVTPAATNKSAVCSSTVPIQPSSGAVETWKVTCNPDDMIVRLRKTAVYNQAPAQYNIVKVPQGALVSGPSNFSTTATMELYQSEYKCRDSGNNPVAKSLCDGLLLSAEFQPMTVAVTVSPAYHKVLVDRDQIAALRPDLDVNLMCSSGTTKFTVPGGGDPWSLTCNPEDVRVHHERAALYVFLHSYNNIVDVAGRNLAPTASNFASTVTMNIYKDQYVCRDNDTGRAVDQSFCKYLPFGREFDPVTIPVVVSPKSQKVYFNKPDLLSARPNVDIGSCVVQMMVNSPNWWPSTCNANEISPN